MPTNKIAEAKRAFSEFAAFADVKGDFSENFSGSAASMTDSQLASAFFTLHTTADGKKISAEHALVAKKLDSEEAATAKSVREELLRRFGRKGLLFFADVDNTVTGKGVLSQEKIDFFNSWERADRVVLSTGKIFKSIEKTAKEMGVHNNPCCCLNGCVLYDGKGGVKIVAKLGEKAALAADYLSKKGLNYVLYYPDALRVETTLRTKDIENLERYDEMFFDKGGVTDFGRVVKLMAFVDEGETDKEEIVDHAASLIGLKALRTAHHCYEIVPRGSDKGRALADTAHSKGGHFALTVAVGDSMNDLPMLDKCGLPFAVCDASDEVKAFNFPVAGQNRKTDLPEMFGKVAKTVFGG